MSDLQRVAGGATATAWATRHRDGTVWGTCLHRGSTPPRTRRRCRRPATDAQHGVSSQRQHTPATLATPAVPSPPSQHDGRVRTRHPGPDTHVRDGQQMTADRSTVPADHGNRPGVAGKGRDSRICRRTDARTPRPREKSASNVSNTPSVKRKKNQGGRKRVTPPVTP